MSDDFTKTRLAWQAQVAIDCALPPTAYRIAIVLFSLFNRQLGYAWPAIPTLAAKLACSENCVRKALHALRDRGHLAIEERGGRGGSNRYRYIIKDKPSTSVEGLSEDANLLQEETLNERGGGASTGVNPIPLNESFEKKKEAPSASEAVNSRERQGEVEAGVSVNDSPHSHICEILLLYPNRKTSPATNPPDETKRARLNKWLSYAQKDGPADLERLSDRVPPGGLTVRLVNEMNSANFLRQEHARISDLLQPSPELDIMTELDAAYRQFKPSKQYTRELWFADVVSWLSRGTTQPNAGILKEVLWDLLTSDEWLPKPPSIAMAYSKARAIQAHHLKMIERLLEIRAKAESVLASQGVSNAQ